MSKFDRVFQIAVATASDDDQYVASTAMKVGAYTVANSGLATTPTGTATGYYGRLTLVTITQQGGTSPDDTMGTVTVKGLTVNGQIRSDTITPTANTTTIGTVPFIRVDSVTGAGWVIDAGDTPTADLIKVGHTAPVIPYYGPGVLKRILHEVSVASTITIADSSGTRITLPASDPVGVKELGMPFAGYLSITQAGASNAIYVVSTDPRDL